MSAAAASSSGGARSVALRPRVVEDHERFVAGPAGQGIRGPTTVRVRFPRPTVRGDLLVAAVIDGVRTSGMPQPHWRIPGWRTAAETIGGQTATGGTGGYSTGGLQAAIFFRPDAPRVTGSFVVGSVPSGTVTDVTVELAELAGLPARLSVDTSGVSTDGPAPRDYTNRSGVTTALAPHHLPELVLAAFANGGTAGNGPNGERFVHPSGWRVIGPDTTARLHQPLLLDERVWRSRRRPAESISYLGVPPIDNCAVMVALYQKR